MERLKLRAEQMLVKQHGAAMFLIRSVEEYRRSGSLKKMLVAVGRILTKPKHMALLADIRSMLHLAHLATFDEEVFIWKETGVPPGTSSFNDDTFLDATIPSIRDGPTFNPVDELCSPQGLLVVTLKPKKKGPLGFTVARGTTVRQTLIDTVTPNSPAHLAGLRVGDVVVAINESRVCGVNYDSAVAFLSEATSKAKPIKLIIRAASHGDESTLVPRRRGRPTSAHSSSSASASASRSSTPAAGPEEMFKLSRRATDESIGMRIRGGMPECHEVFVTEVDPGSRAALAGLRPGLRIISVNGNATDGALHSAVTQQIRNSLDTDICAVYVGLSAAAAALADGARLMRSRAGTAGGERPGSSMSAAAATATSTSAAAAAPDAARTRPRSGSAGADVPAVGLSSTDAPPAVVPPPPRSRSASAAPPVAEAWTAALQQPRSKSAMATVRPGATEPGAPAANTAALKRRVRVQPGGVVATTDGAARVAPPVVANASEADGWPWQQRRRATVTAAPRVRSHPLDAGGAAGGGSDEAGKRLSPLHRRATVAAGGPSRAGGRLRRSDPGAMVRLAKVAQAKRAEGPINLGSSSSGSRETSKQPGAPPPKPPPRVRRPEAAFAAARRHGQAGGPSLVSVTVPAARAPGLHAAMMSLPAAAGRPGPAQASRSGGDDASFDDDEDDDVAGDGSGSGGDGGDGDDEGFTGFESPRKADGGGDIGGGGGLVNADRAYESPGPSSGHPLSRGWNWAGGEMTSTPAAARPRGSRLAPSGLSGAGTAPPPPVADAACLAPESPEALEGFANIDASFSDGSSNSDTDAVDGGGATVPPPRLARLSSGAAPVPPPPPPPPMPPTLTVAIKEQPKSIAAPTTAARPAGRALGEITNKASDEGGGGGGGLLDAIKGFNKAKLAAPSERVRPEPAPSATDFNSTVAAALKARFAMANRANTSFASVANNSWLDTTTTT